MLIRVCTTCEVSVISSDLVTRLFSIWIPCLIIDFFALCYYQVYIVLIFFFFFLESPTPIVAADRLKTSDSRKRLTQRENSKDSAFDGSTVSSVCTLEDEELKNPQLRPSDVQTSSSSLDVLEKYVFL